MIQMIPAAARTTNAARSRTGLDSAVLARLLAPVAWRIHLARRDRQMTVRALARSASFRPATIRGFETGARTVSAEAVSRLAQGLGIDEEELYPGGRPDAFWEQVGEAMREWGGAASDLAAHDMPGRRSALPLAA